MTPRLLLLAVLSLTWQSAVAQDLGRGRKLMEEGSYEQAFYELLPLAEAQDAAAQYLVGGLYLLGHGVPQDPDEARKWMIRSAHNGHAEAAMALAEFSAKGVGAKPDPQQSLFWYRKAAEQGVPEAQTILGKAMAVGKGMPRDAKMGSMWLERAAKQGHAEAQTALAKLLETGGGQMKADAARALYWYAVVAKSGGKEAEKPRDALARQLGKKGKLAMAEAQRFTARPEHLAPAPPPSEERQQMPKAAAKKDAAAAPADGEGEDKSYPSLPPPRHMGKSSYKIQVASGASQTDVARQASKLRLEMRDLLGEMEVAIVYGEAGFTALMGPFANADQAEAMCAKLETRGFKNCSSVPP